MFVYLQSSHRAKLRMKYREVMASYHTVVQHDVPPKGQRPKGYISITSRTVDDSVCPLLSEILKKPLPPYSVTPAARALIFFWCYTPLSCKARSLHGLTSGQDTEYTYDVAGAFPEQLLCIHARPGHRNPLCTHRRNGRLDRAASQGGQPADAPPLARRIGFRVCHPSNLITYAII